MSNGQYKSAMTEASEAAEKWVQAHEEYLLLLNQKPAPADQVNLQAKRLAAARRAEEAQKEWRAKNDALRKQIDAIGYPVE